MKDTDALEAMYRRLLRSGSAMAPHMPALRRFAEGKECVEFGVKRGHSTVAMLCTAKSLVSVDIEMPAKADMEAWKKASDGAWTFVLGDTADVIIPTCDVLLIDANHTYTAVKTELARHANRVRQFLIFHDTITFGSIGADGESGEHSWRYKRGESVPEEHLGIRPAIDELMALDWAWRIDSHDTRSHGLLVLWRS